MQRYYRAARHIRLINELVMGELRFRLLPPIKARKLTCSPEHATDFRLVGNLLDASETLFEDKPHLLLETFLVLAREPGINGCTPRLLRALARAGRSIDSGFRRDPANQRRFISLLSQAKGRHFMHAPDASARHPRPLHPAVRSHHRSDAARPVSHLPGR
jgi:[protein-PII] uridylyltransferase